MSYASERGREALLFCSNAVLPQLQHFGGGSVYDRVQRGPRKAQHVQERELSPDVGLMEKWVQFLVCCTISYRTCPWVHFQNEGLSSYSSGSQLLGSSSFSFPCSWEVAFQTAASPLGKAVGNELLKRLFWDLISFKAFPLTFYFQGVGCSLDKAFCGWDFFFSWLPWGSEWAAKSWSHSSKGLWRFQGYSSVFVIPLVCVHVRPRLASERAALFPLINLEKQVLPWDYSTTRTQDKKDGTG